MLRGEVLTALAVFGHDPTLDEASRRFYVFLKDRNTPLLPPDLRKVVKSKTPVGAYYYSNQDTIDVFSFQF